MLAAFPPWQWKDVAESVAVKIQSLREINQDIRTWNAILLVYSLWSANKVSESTNIMDMIV